MRVAAGNIRQAVPRRDQPISVATASVRKAPLDLNFLFLNLHEQHRSFANPTTFHFLRPVPSSACLGTPSPCRQLRLRD